MFSAKHTIPSSSGVAARLKQKREADLDRMERDKQFPVIFVKSYGFRPYFSNHDSVNISGPLCPGSLSKDRQCLAELSGDSIEAITPIVMFVVEHMICRMVFKNLEQLLTKHMMAS